MAIWKQKLDGKRLESVSFAGGRLWVQWNLLKVIKHQLHHNCMKKPIAQEDPLGCGIACVAWITGKTYKQAKDLYFKDVKRAGTVGYFCRDLVSALAMAKKQYSYRYLRKKARFNEDSIVFIKRSKRYPAGHYLVKTAEVWMDPWINFDCKKPYLTAALAGFRKRLPGKPIYLVDKI